MCFQSLVANYGDCIRPELKPYSETYYAYVICYIENIISATMKVLWIMI